ncbi:hypothetical protein B0919_21640 [Hymenobacter sp. CRA2]|nr:hypothetical protein B0919_21640 [Hymenobacter sp. CRA2]
MLPVDLDTVEANQLARMLLPQATHPRLLIDCARLKSLRTLGVSHVVSQLLVLHQGGAEIWLANVTPLLGRCLGLLRLGQLFHLA